jgi:ethanolamine ammonia-lyase small subunit
MRPPLRDLWAPLARRTPARIALGRASASLPTREVLTFALAHARARDAVHAALDIDDLQRGLAALGLDAIAVASEAAAEGRSLFLRRPDYGRRLSQASRERLVARAAPPTASGADLALMIGDGLSAAAIKAHAVPLLAAFLPRAAALGLSLAPVVAANGARVALGDEVGELLNARAIAVLIGERPGLSSPDSLGVYLTHAPKPGRSDAERNCISNIRAEGLGYDLAAFKLAWLVREALRRLATGVALKDESDTALAALDVPAGQIPLLQR